MCGVKINIPNDTPGLSYKAENVACRLLERNVVDDFVVAKKSEEFDS